MTRFDLVIRGGLVVTPHATDARSPADAVVRGALP